MSRTVRLYEHHGPTSIFIDAEIGDGGEVIVSGQDIGEAPEKFYGDSDYEYWMILGREHKDALLLFPLWAHWIDRNRITVR